MPSLPATNSPSVWGWQFTRSITSTRALGHGEHSVPPQRLHGYSSFRQSRWRTPLVSPSITRLGHRLCAVSKTGHDQGRHRLGCIRRCRLCPTR